MSHVSKKKPNNEDGKNRQKISAKNQRE